MLQSVLYHSLNYMMVGTCYSTLLVLLAVLCFVIAEDPLVTLNHGGQLRGKKFDYDGMDIELFLGKPTNEYVYADGCLVKFWVVSGYVSRWIGTSLVRYLSG